MSTAIHTKQYHTVLFQRRSLETRIPPARELWDWLQRIGGPRIRGSPNTWASRLVRYLPSSLAGTRTVHSTGSPYAYFPNPKQLRCGEKANKVKMDEENPTPKVKLDLSQMRRSLKQALVTERKRSQAAATGATWHHDCHYNTVYGPL
mgnify:CR=1 FL=1